MTNAAELAAGPPPLEYRVRTATRSEVPPIVMLHGLGGDERAIWELEPSLPSGGLVAAPRAPYLQSTGGYGWVPKLGAWPPNLAEFAESVRTLEGFLAFLVRVHKLDRRKLVLFGFSQGGAMAFAAAMSGAAGLSVPPAALVVVAGHLPQGELVALSGLPIFWGHGARDELIPVTVARNDVERLRAAGAQVRYCEADVRHKLGLVCLKELKQWIPARFGDLQEDVRSR